MTCAELDTHILLEYRYVKEGQLGGEMKSVNVKDLRP